MTEQGFERELERALGSRIVRVRPVGGGCISSTVHVQFVDGACFAKLSPESPDLLSAEVDGLEALRASGTVRVPRILAQGTGWLALEWLEPGSGNTASWSELGSEVAALHRTTSLTYGWERNNYIGTLPQVNAESSDWAVFWREQRLRPQMKRAAAHFDERSRDEFEEVCDRLPVLLSPAQAEGASLLHGDLWSGNVHMLAAGGAAVIDPSTYRGHREVDLAMAALFGGFPPAFWSAYAAAWPLVQPGLEARRAVYQLYYLLVHVNLFGGGYAAQAAAAMRRAL